MTLVSLFAPKLNMGVEALEVAGIEGNVRGAVAPALNPNDGVEVLKAVPLRPLPKVGVDTDSFLACTSEGPNENPGDDPLTGVAKEAAVVDDVVVDDETINDEELVVCWLRG